MKQFFRDVFRQLAASMVAFLLFAAFLICGLLAMALVFGEETTPIRDGSVLVVDLSTEITDTPPEASLVDFINGLLGDAATPRLGLRAVIDALDAAREDDRIVGLVLHNEGVFNGSAAGLAGMRELRDALLRFTRSGKRSVAHLTSPSLGDYYLASAADEIALHPMGEIAFPGMAAELLFVGDALEKYGVEVQLAQVGRFKSAGEMFTRNSLSREARIELETLLADIWDGLLPAIADSRGMTPEVARQLAADIGFFDTADALVHGLADSELHFDELLDQLLEFGEYDEDYDTVRQVTLGEYIGQRDQPGSGLSLGKKDSIAIVYAEGQIVPGEGDVGQIGGDWLGRELRRLRRSDSVKAVVLRVNSPGGSAVASEVIAREMRLLAEKKPVVVSMGDLAASGGYWISAEADAIFAQPETITGSIGVIAIIPSVRELGNRFGVTFDGVKTDPLADLYTISRSKTDEEMGMIRDDARQIYERFLDMVATGRSMPREEVATIAEGRVWSGVRAHQLGLVDELGGLGPAIARAAELAGLGEDYDLREIPGERTFDNLLEQLLAAPEPEPPLAGKGALRRVARSVEAEWRRWETLSDPRHAYTQLPWVIHWR